MIQTQIEPEVQRPAQQASPALIFECLNRHQHTMALKGAIDLGLFTQIARGATTPRAIAARCDLDERAVRILCDFMTILGFLRKEDGRYSLTPDSAIFLDQESPAYLGSIARFLASPATLGRYRDVATLVRRGTALEDTESTASDNGRWMEYANSMAPVVAIGAQRTAPLVSEPGRKMKVLDIAAGPGMFGIAVARHNPAAEIVALDAANVLTVATENAAKAGVLDRYRTIAGDVFEVDLGSGYDLVLIPNFLHIFDVQSNIRLLAKVRAAMNPGGRLATVEFVPNEDRVSPPIAASFALIMLAGTEHGDAYTFRDLDHMFRSAGFAESRMQPLEPTPMQLILTSRS